MPRLVSFEFLGHVPYQHQYEGGVATACKKCGCWDAPDDAQNFAFPQSNNPCGDPLGATVKVVPGLRDGRHAWDYIWRNTVIGYQIRY